MSDTGIAGRSTACLVLSGTRSCETDISTEAHDPLHRYDTESAAGWRDSRHTDTDSYKYREIWNN